MILIGLSLPSNIFHEGIIFSIDCGVNNGQLIFSESAASFERLDFITDGRSGLIACIVFLVFGRDFLDDGCEIFSPRLVHLKEHLLALATIWFVVVDEQVAQDPLIELEPRLEAAAELASAPCATFTLVSLWLLLIGVQALAVLTQKSLGGV